MSDEITQTAESATSHDEGMQESTGHPKTGLLRDQYRLDGSRSHYPPKQRSWHARPRSPGLKWHGEYNPTNLKRGRVLVIDYVKQTLSKAGTRKVAAQEISDIEGLRRIYSNPIRGSEAILRVFHVQNAQWATQFLLRKFNINARDDLVGSDFGRYLRYKRPERRGGKPFLSGKTWKPQHDPWRGISKTAFGIDYVKLYAARDPDAQGKLEDHYKMLELNRYDTDDNPVYGWDAYVQRISVYVQHKESFTELPNEDDPDIENPYKEDRKTEHNRHEYVPHLDTLDNGNAILIFDNSHTGSIEDTMIAARRQWEARWRRLPFYLVYEGSHDVSNDDRMALQCMKMVLADIWKSTAESWEGFLDIADTHISILEDKIYEEPADESRAPELWTNSNWWLKMERLMFTHVDVVRECQANLRELADDPAVSDLWLEATPGDFERLSNRVQEDLVKPTANLADLMYKSVGIRDSRHSLQLSMSMWRLSWITFIFLPLLAMCSAFGMNVNTFKNDPSIKWYFISTVPLMLIVLVSWYGLKHTLEQSRQTPYSRGIYEHLFYELATSYPLLWSRSGPHQDVRPKGRLARWKWWLILRWSVPEKTIRAGSVDEEDQFDGLGTWSRLKRHWLRVWTAEIQMADRAGASGSKVGGKPGEMGAVTEGIGEATEVINLAGSEGVDKLESGMLRVPFDLSQRMASSATISAAVSAGRPSSQGSSAGRNSGVMVEEELPDWLAPKGN